MVLYVIEISRQKDLLNIYYGARIDAEDIEAPGRLTAAFSCCADDNDSEYSLSVLAQEYPSAGASDFRSPAYEITNDIQGARESITSATYLLWILTQSVL